MSFIATVLWGPADLDGCVQIGRRHIAEAVGYRSTEPSGLESHLGLIFVK